MYIYDGYGQTETVNILANFRCLPAKRGSMGVPVSGFSVDIIDDYGNPVSLNTEGDIAIKIKRVENEGIREDLKIPLPKSL